MTASNKYSKLTYTSEDDPLLRRLVINTVEIISGRQRIQRLYEEMQDMEYEPHESWSLALDQLKIGRKYDEQLLERLHSDGPVVVISNHPFGVVDGLILAEITSKIQTKFSILVNIALCGHDEKINEFLLPISFDETKESAKINIETKRIATERLKRGEALAIFPSGGVATAPKLWKKAEDLEWKRFASNVISKSGATVLPMFVHGRNSFLFQIASHIHESLRLGFLMFEVRNKMGKEVNVTLGKPIPPEKIKEQGGKQALLDYLRGKVFELGEAE